MSSDTAEGIKTERSHSPSDIVKQEKSAEPPVHEVVGGSSVRQYLNKHMTKTLLDGLYEVGRTKPENPLVYLGEYLIRKGKEESGTGGE